MKKLNFGLMLLLVAMLLGSVPAQAAPANQSDGVLFPETGKRVPQLFYTYWQSHGALKQQGYPVSDAINEQSPVDGKSYLTQYFERAVFEYHAENPANSQVLLSLVGRFRFQEKYGNGGVADTGGGQMGGASRTFAETGQTVRGLFLTYWQNNGGLAQQGFPISPLFQEKSDTDGKTYWVQYFERAVFEWHQENAGGPNEVLLSLLGKQRFDRRGGGGGQAGGNPPPPSCPNGKSINAVVEPGCGKAGTAFRFAITGFYPGERISFWITDPDGNVVGTAAPLELGAHNGTFVDELSGSATRTLRPGQWALTFQGEGTGNRAIAYFYILP